MGEARLKKSSGVDGGAGAFTMDAMRAGVTMASELIRHPAFLSTSMAAELMSSRMAANDDIGVAAKMVMDFESVALELDESVTAEVWASTFLPALDNANFVRFLNKAASRGRTSFWEQKDSVGALLFGGNQRPDEGSKLSQDMIRVHRRLLSDAGDPGWIALTILAIYRSATVNSKRAFGADVWSESTIAWFELEKSIRHGAGKSAAQAVSSMNRKFAGGQFAEALGSNLLHALAEAAINAGNTKLFV